MTTRRVDVGEPIAALVLDAQAGDRAALGELIAAHLPLIYNVIGRALGGHADVDDLVQETMVAVVRGLAGLRDPERFRSWATAIAYRQIQLHQREQRARLYRLGDAPSELPDPTGDFAERTVTELMLSGQRRDLVEAVRWLDDGDRRLLSLWWREEVGELTRTDLAAVLGVTPPHAAVRLQRMKARLDAVRCVVRALAALRTGTGCAELAGLVRGWNGVADGRWRKRLGRHARGCAACGSHRRSLVPPEDLVLGVPLPFAVAEGLRMLADAAVSAPSLGQLILSQVQGYLQSKTVAVATAATVAVGGGLAFAVYEMRGPDEGSTAVGPAVTTSAAAEPPAATAPATVPPTPTPRPTSMTGVASADLYVAPDGSDAGDGSLERPFATLGQAVATVRPGQTIALRGGTYRPTEPVVIDTSGEPGRRITLSNYRSERAVIDASLVPTDKWMVTHRGDHWTVQGLEIRNSGSHAYVCTSCRANTFRRLSMHHNVRSGLTLRDAGTAGNQVLDSDFFANYDPSDRRGRSGVGLAIKFGSGSGNLVRGCRAFHNADAGIDVGHFSDAIRLEHNWSYGNGVNRWNASDWQANADGFHLGGGAPAPAAAHVLEHNAAWDNIGHGFSDGGNPGPLRLHNNTAFRNGAVGFSTPAGLAELHRNAAIGNATPATFGVDAESAGNTWDGGGWTEAMFRSTSAAAAQGARRPDGRLPATSFLVPAAGVGASMA